MEVQPICYGSICVMIFGLFKMLKVKHGNTNYRDKKEHLLLFIIQVNSQILFCLLSITVWFQLGMMVLSVCGIMVPRDNFIICIFLHKVSQLALNGFLFRRKIMEGWLLLVFQMELFVSCFLMLPVFNWLNLSKFTVNQSPK